MRKLVVLFLIMFLGIICSPAFAQYDKDHTFLKGLDSFKKGNYENAISIFEDLKANGYEKENPFLLFVLSKALKMEGVERKNIALFNESLNEINEYRKYYAEGTQEYKSSVVNAGYIYFASGNYRSGLLLLNGYLDKFPSDQDARLCKAYLLNLWGKELFDKKEIDRALEKFKSAYELKKYPLFARNLLSAYLSEKNYKNNCDEICKIYNQIKNKKDWIEGDKCQEISKLVEKSCQCEEINTDRR